MSTTPPVPARTDADRGDRGDRSITGADAGGPAGRSLRSVIPWVVVVIALALATIAAYGWSQASTEAETRDDIETVAGRAVSTLTTWDASDLGPVERAVTEFGTDRFQQEASEIFGEFATGLEQASVTSAGEVLELAVAEVAGDRALALATVRQEVTNTSIDGDPVASCWGARVTVVQLDGAWLVDQVALFGPNACDDRVGTDTGS